MRNVEESRCCIPAILRIALAKHFCVELTVFYHICYRAPLFPSDNGARVYILI